MKRAILFITISILSVSFACKSPHDVIAGIKVGCPLNDQEAKVVEKNGNYYVDQVGFFDTGHLIVDQEIVDGIVFQKSYNVTYKGRFTVGDEMKNDISNFIYELNKRWGEFVNSKAKYNLERGIGMIPDGFFDVKVLEEIKAPSSSYIGEIRISLESILPLKDKTDHPATFTVYYLSDRLSKDMKEAEQEQYKGF